MPGGLVVILGLLFSLVLPLGLLFAAVTAWAVEPLIRTVRPLPLIGGPLGGLLQSIEDGLLSFARQAVTTGMAMYAAGVRWLEQGVGDVARAIIGLLPQLVQELRQNVASIGEVLLLSAVSDVDTKIPQVFRDLENALQQLPNEPAFRHGGPLRQLLDWLARLWSLVRALGPFARTVAAPIVGLLLLLWGVVETIGRITRLETVQAGLVRFTENVRQDQLADEAAFAQLVIVVNSLLLQGRQLQVDLERERAARVALATQTQQALNAAESRFQTQLAGVGNQLTPLLVLGVLASLGASGLDVLRKTAQCDPCGRLDQGDWSDLPDRVEALENFGP